MAEVYEGGWQTGKAPWQGNVHYVADSEDYLGSCGDKTGFIYIYIYLFIIYLSVWNLITIVVYGYIPTYGGYHHAYWILLVNIPIYNLNCPPE